ncbi:MAG: lysine--tRNA ligase [Spirochaetia bacterium]|nr:lysine--tRNA ligase [Spirochaetia bacterium]MBR4797366.1 lysine--tRNA ligase [Spirochaetia bacterium]
MDTKENTQSVHWADITADKIIRERKQFLNDKKTKYVCASGITPSGTVHIGNFREIISVELVVRALRQKGADVRFIYSWDDYDVFRKVPKNMPKQEELEKYLRFPITMVPDPWGKESSYARAHEVELEGLLPQVGVYPEYLYQASNYQASRYAEGMRKALENKAVIKAILDEFRTTPLPDDWMPISMFCGKCHKDTTTVLSWDGEWGVTYRCDSCGCEETVDLRTTSIAKLPWRIDWPMRWGVEGVDFEPAGKDHHSEGGSFSTAKGIARKVYNHEPPVTFQYDFLSIKGRGGKISSSSGEVISLRDVLEIYQPEIVRYMFASTRPNTEFAISFDLDVLKIYEDYDKCERIYFGVEKVNDKKAEKEKRIYELSQVGDVPEVMPYQIPLRHLCNLLQIHNGNIDEVLKLCDIKDESQVPRLRNRAECAWRWITTFAPEDFRFALKTPGEEPVSLDDTAKAVLQQAAAVIENLDKYDEKALAEELYAVAEKAGMDSKDMFTLFYNVLIGKEKGPRLAGFIKTCGKEKVLPILKAYF